MERITDDDQYKRLIKETKDRCGRLDTNCMTGAKGFSEVIAGNRLFYERVPEGIMVLADEGEFFRLYYHLGRNPKFPEITAQKPILLEEPDNCDRRKEYLMGLFGKIRTVGFEKVAVNLMVSANPAKDAESIEDRYRKAVQRIKDHGLEISVCGTAMVGAVVELWKKHLKLTDIPEEHLAFADDPAQKVVCVVDHDGRVRGVNWWQIRGRNCEIRHTVTAPESQRMGIGYALVMTALNDAADAGCTNAYTYISDVNYRSLELYSKAGMPVNGKISYQYLLQSERKEKSDERQDS